MRIKEKSLRPNITTVSQLHHSLEEQHISSTGGITVYIPFVGIGSPNSLPPQAGVSLPLDSKGGGATQPIRTTGKKAWHSVYSLVIGKKGLTLLYIMQSHRSGTCRLRLINDKYVERDALTNYIIDDNAHE